MPASRILLFTGKGGVGKTTCAAATAIQAARAGLRTLILSADPAHSLADALDRPLGPEAVLIEDNLWAQEVDLYYSMQKYWGNMRQLMLTVFKWQGVDQIAAEELAALPGMGEASALLWVDQAYHSGAYDLIVMDTAPTGETLTLLTLPRVTQWWLQKAFPFQKTALKVGGFAVRATTGIPLDKGYDELDRLFTKLADVQKVLQDPAIGSARIVMNPERMVIQEARRAYTYLQLYGFNVDACIVNRVLPESAADGPMAGYVAAQAGYLEEIENTFAPLPILHVPHLGREAFGVDALADIGAGLYADHDPAAVLHKEPTYRLDADGDHYVLALRLPLLGTADVDAKQYGDQLVVQVGNQRLNHLLPNFLRYYVLGDVRVGEGWLRARFEPGAAGQKKK